MLQKRVIPVLLLRNESLVKTVKFDKFIYIGDPCNTVKIFNEFEVDELIFLDILATQAKRNPNFSILANISSECFMPLGYGGGIRSLDQAKAVFDVGFEKIVINSFAVENPKFIEILASHFGSQAVVVSIDVKKTFFRTRIVKSVSGRCATQIEPVCWARQAEALGAGEILLTAIDREGTWQGFDIDLIRQVSSSVSIPVIAHGGAGSVADIRNAVVQGGASAVALGSMVVFQKKNMGVLINMPQIDQSIFS